MNDFNLLACGKKLDSIRDEEIDYFYNMDASEVEQGLIDLGLSSEPSDSFLRLFDEYGLEEFPALKKQEQGIEPQ